MGPSAALTRRLLPPADLEQPHRVLQPPVPVTLSAGHLRTRPPPPFAKPVLSGVEGESGAGPSAATGPSRGQLNADKLTTELPHPAYTWAARRLLWGCTRTFTTEPFRPTSSADPPAVRRPANQSNDSPPFRFAGGRRRKLFRRQSKAEYGRPKSIRPPEGL